jgi:hypothetical protein
VPNWSNSLLMRAPSSIGERLSRCARVSEVRKQIAFLLLSVAVASVVVYAGVDGFIPRASASSVQPMRSITLPGTFSELTARGNEVEASSCGDGGHDEVVINPITLKVQPLRCGSDPQVAVSLETVNLGPISALGSCQPESQGVRAARLSPTGRYEAVGPIIIRFAGSCSQTRPLTVYSGTSLWAYDCSSGPNANSGQLVQLSSLSGIALTTATMPAICWTRLGADSSGAFIASYENPGPIYFLANGAHSATVALQTSGKVLWFYDLGSSVVAEVAPIGQGTCAPVRCGLWLLERPRPSARLLSSYVPDTGNPESVTWSASEGLIVADQSEENPRLSGTETYRLVDINTDTGTLRGLATLQLPFPTVSPELEVLDGYLFALGNDELYRFRI